MVREIVKERNKNEIIDNRAIHLTAVITLYTVEFYLQIKVTIYRLFYVTFYDTFHISGYISATIDEIVVLFYIIEVFKRSQWKYCPGNDIKLI